MLLCIQPIFKIVTAAWLSSPPCSACMRFCNSFLLTADIRARSFTRLQPKSCRSCKSKSSTAPIRLNGSSFCRAVGLSNALSRGLIAAAGWPRISKISPETRSLFSAWPQFASAAGVTRRHVGDNFLHERWPGNRFDRTSCETVLFRLNSATRFFSRAFSSESCLNSRT